MAATLESGALGDAVPAPAGAPDDAALVEAAQRGSREAFGVFVGRYHGLVWSIAYCLTGNVSHADDVAQETFLAVWRKLPELRSESARAYLGKIARNFSLMQLRRRGTDQRTRAEDLEIQSSEPSPLDRMIMLEDQAAMHRALCRIPEAYRLPLILFYRENKSAARVAEVLCLSEDNVRQRLVRGRKILQEHFMRSIEAAMSQGRSPKELTAGVLIAISGTAAGTAEAATESAFRKLASTSRTIKVLLVTATAATSLLLTAIGVTRGSRVVEGWRPNGSGDPARTRMAAPASPATPTFEPGALSVAASDRKESTAFTKDPGISVFKFDFEDGILPEVFVTGHLAPGPPRSGNRYAVMGTLEVRRDYESSTGNVRLVTRGLPYRDTLVVTFDYWSENDGVGLGVWDKDRRTQYQREFKGTVLERWGHAALLLSELPPIKPSGPMRPGDEIGSIQIEGGLLGGKPFFVDNIRVVDYPADELTDARYGLDLKVHENP